MPAPASPVVVLYSGPKQIPNLDGNRRIENPQALLAFWRKEKNVFREKERAKPMISSISPVFLVSCLSPSFSDSLLLKVSDLPAGTSFSSLSIVDNEQIAVGKALFYSNAIVVPTFTPILDNGIGKESTYQAGLHYLNIALGSVNDCLIYCTYPQSSQGKADSNLLQRAGGSVVAIAQDGTVAGYASGYSFSMQVPLRESERIDMAAAKEASPFTAVENVNGHYVFSSGAPDKILSILLPSTQKSTYQIVLVEGFPFNLVINKKKHFTLTAQFVEPQELR